MTCWKGSSSSGGSRTALHLMLPPCGECGGQREGESAGACIRIVYQKKVVCVCVCERERILLTCTFMWSATHRDQRLRHHLGTRYDARDGVFDWDYHMRLAELVGPPHRGWAA